MNNKKTIAVLIVAAGNGERFGTSTPKQYHSILGKNMLRWNIDLFNQMPDIYQIFVSIHPQHSDEFEKIAAQYKGRSLQSVSGGKTRQESVKNGLDFIAQQSNRPDYILIHDAARPALSTILVSEIIESLDFSDAVIPGIPVHDTVKRLMPDGKTKTENREGLFTVQTPQAFKFDLIHTLHQQYKDQPVTDDAALCELAGYPVKIITGDKDNIKITHPDDMTAVEKILMNRCDDIRTGKGYDVHKLVAPQHPFQKLKLCGVEIQHETVLEGHSDADVALHAITDALLATICDGDIGMHFSPKDQRWKNADSAQFLKHAADLVRAQNGIITHIDVTIICEAPKIGPLRGKMRERIADIIDIPLQRVSVKATTTEGLGFTGRKEGIAAESVVTVRLPFQPFAIPSKTAEETIIKVKYA